MQCPGFCSLAFAIVPDPSEEKMGANPGTLQNCGESEILILMVTQVLERSFAASSQWQIQDSILSLELAAGLTPHGLDLSPNFFNGVITHPRSFSLALQTVMELVTSDVDVSTPPSLRDPIFSAHNECLRIEGFSGGVSTGVELVVPERCTDGAEIGLGTTNVDLNPAVIALLSKADTHNPLRVEARSSGVQLSTKTHNHSERKVSLPNRWVNALGNMAVVRQRMDIVCDLKGTAAQRGASTLISSSAPVAWLSLAPSGIELSKVPKRAGTKLTALRRLYPLRRLLGQIETFRIYADEEGAFSVELGLPCGWLIVSLTQRMMRSWASRGAYLDDVSQSLNHQQLGFRTGFQPTESLNHLAAHGVMGFDLRTRTYFHRELPMDSKSLQVRNPRLRGLGQDMHIEWSSPALALVESAGEAGVIYRVNVKSETCTCAWFVHTAGKQGPCKHILVAKRAAKGAE